jgi:hydrogenase maturation protein HypF
VLATGAFFKNAVCVTRGDEAFLSQHVGDLDNAPTARALEETVAHLLKVLDVEPALVAHDLHPDFHSTRFAVAYARVHGIAAVGVQHHHAHIAAVAAEHGVTGPVLGLALVVGLGRRRRASWVDGARWRRKPARCACRGRRATRSLTWRRAPCARPRGRSFGGVCPARGRRADARRGVLPPSRARARFDTGLLGVRAVS